MRCAVVAILIGLGGGVGASGSDRPNVLLICIDDLKPLLGCYGNEVVKSPNIDELASRGLRFDAAYCNQAVCAPSRNALLTGLRPQTLGIYDLGTFFRESRREVVTLPQHFKNHGYVTQSLGKIFHTGHGNHDDKKSWSVPSWGSHVVRYALPESRAPQGLTREEALFDNVPAARANKLPKGMAYEAADVPDASYPDGQVADEVVRRLRDAAGASGEPFFMAVGFVKPHLPFCAPKKYWDLYEREDFQLPALKNPPLGAPDLAPTTWGELRQYRGVPDQGELSDDLVRTLIHGYYAATSYMDAQVGRVLQALDETGLANDTIIVFWGDHGWHLGDHGMWCKHTNYEQATRIPLLIVAPGITSAASTTASLVESVDVYPTLCNAAGLPSPGGLDGADMTAVLKDPMAHPKDAIFHVFPRGRTLGRAVRTAKHRLVEWKVPQANAATAEWELYDYQKDPAETKNLAHDYPDVVAELQSILAKQPEPKPQIRPSPGISRAKAAKKLEN